MYLRTILKERASDLNIFINSKPDSLIPTCMDLTHSLKKNLNYIESGKCLFGQRKTCNDTLGQDFYDL